jgi:deoxyribodipyrimidine photo-lyase
MMEKNALYWFRNDLRLEDNIALFHAVSQSDEVYPVYILDEREFETTEIGHSKTGPFRTKFLLEALQDVKSSLQEKGSDLTIRKGKPEEIIPRLCYELNVAKVYASKEITSEETKVESELEQRLWNRKIEMELFWQSTLFHVDDIPWPINNLPDIFTKFRKEAEKLVDIRELISCPDTLSSNFPENFETGALPSIEDLDMTLPAFDERSVLHFIGGEHAGQNRLKDYLWNKDALKTYKETRNGLIGGDYSSKLSPWLSLGCISPRQVYVEIKKYERDRVKNQSTYWLFFELMWRDYFRFAAKKYGDRIFKVKGIKNEPFEYTENKSLFEKWKAGNTGIPFIDANMRELNHTGFMSNRGRQNVASFLVKDLKIKWTWGASYFEHKLIDYDPCSNWCNWNYVAGVGNDPRDDRYFNIMSQAKRYDPNGDYVKLWIPELNGLPSSKIHHPAIYLPKELQEYSVKIGSDYPKPIVPFKKWVY